jgi:SAM-dependent methyltransferase
LLERHERAAAGPLPEHDLAYGAFDLIALHNMFLESCPEYFFEDGKFIKVWGKGGETEKGTQWDSLVGLSLYLLQSAGVVPGTDILDCGSGGGELDIAMALLLRAKVTGVEFNGYLHAGSVGFREWLKERGLPLDGNPEYIKGDFLEQDFSRYKTLYYFQNGSFRPDLLEEKVIAELSPGASFAVFSYSNNGHIFDKLKQVMSFELRDRSAIFRRYDTNEPSE